MRACPVTPTDPASTLADSASQEPRSGDAASQAPRAAGERALDCFLAAGFERTEPPILHPAAIFLDMSGEEIRRRLFLTADAAGEELCLRPEYTIPVCRAYLASDKAGGIAEYSYLGPVFRARAGRGRRADADRARKLRPPGRRSGRRGDVLARHGGGDGGGRGQLMARLGDAGLFDGVLDSLEHAGGVAAAPAPRRRPGLEPRGHPHGARARARSPNPACWRRSRAPTTPARRRWSRTCSRSPASTRSAGAAQARSPTAFWSRRR